MLASTALGAAIYAPREFVIYLCYCCSALFLLVFAAILTRFGILYRGPKRWLVCINLLFFFVTALPAAITTISLVATPLRIDWLALPIGLGLAVALVEASFAWIALLAVLLLSIVTVLTKGMPAKAKFANLSIDLVASILVLSYVYMAHRPSHW